MTFSFFNYLPVILNINDPICKKRVFRFYFSFSVLSLFLIFDSNNAFSQKYDHVPNTHTDGDSIIHFIKNNVIHIGDV
jgi:hypothetical protein